MNAMTYLLGTYWLWMIIALAIGGIVGFATFDRDARGWWPERWPGWLKLAGLVFLAGLIVAPLKLLPGRAGLLLETALFLFPCYILGCLLGSWLASLRDREVPVLALPAGQPSSLRDRVRSTPEPVIPSVPTAEPAMVEPVGPAADLKPIRGIGPSNEAALPQPAPPVADGVERAGTPPTGFLAPVGGRADDLKRIRGIGRQNEDRLNALGIWHFHQIAAWTQAHADWVGDYLHFPGRITREAWVEQAAKLAQGVETEFSRRVDLGMVPTSSDDGPAG